MVVAKTPLAHPVPPPSAASPFETPRYKEVEAFFTKMSAGDRPTRWQDASQWEMSHVHLFLLGQLERSYAFAQWAVDNDDVANYLGYVEVALFNIVSHHAFEEEEIFPFMVKAAGNDIWNRNVAEHHLFSEALDATWLYVRHCRAALAPAAWPPTPVPEPSDAIKSIDMTRYSANLDLTHPFDPMGFRRHIDGFMPSLIEHLRDEIDTLAPEVIEPMGQEADEELRKMVQTHLKGYDPKWFLCSAFTAVPMITVKQLLALPFFVRRILVPFVFGPKYIGFWRYSVYPENLSWAGTA